MIREQDLPKVEAPSKRALAKATGAAAGIAAILLFTAILPAEYGFDPLHTGAALRLTELSKAAARPSPALAPADGQPVWPATTYTSQPSIYKVDSEDLALHPGQGVEIKYHMQKGATMVYSWKASGKLTFEF